MKRITSIFLTISIMSVFLLSGCTPSSQDEYVCEVTMGKVLSMDVSKVSDEDSLMACENTVEGLYLFDKDQNVIGGMAESYEVSEDGLTYIFHLRDAKWDNSDPVTAEDFVFGWRRLLQERGPYASLLTDTAPVKNARAIYYGDGNGNYMDISELGVYADDEKTFRVELEMPVPYFYSIVGFPSLAPLNEDFFNSLEEGMYGTSPDTIMCNGPFVLESYMPGTSLVRFKKNKSYWNKDAVKVPGVKLLTVSSVDVAVEAFENNFCDIVEISGSHIEEAKKDDELKDCILSCESCGQGFLTCNVEGDLKNTNLRLAISNAIDRESIVSNVLNDNAEPSYSSCCKNLYFNPVTGEDFTKEPEAYSEYCSYDLKKAGNYFELAKKELKKDHIEIELTIKSDAQGVKMGAAIKEQLEQNLDGLVINLNAVSFAERLQKEIEHDYEMILGNWSPDYPDPKTFMDMYISDSATNRSGFSNKEFDDLMEKCYETDYVYDEEKRFYALQDADMLLVKNAAKIPLYVSKKCLLVNPDVSGAARPPVTLKSFIEFEKVVSEE